MSAILEPDELQRLTGYRRPAEQLAELLRQGFYRARRSRNGAGDVVLERAHFEAISHEREQAKREADCREACYTPEEMARTKKARQYEGSALQRHAQASVARTEAAADARRQYLADHAEEIAEARKQAREASIESRRELVLFHANKRRAAKLHRTPPWADECAIKAMYAEAARLTRETGEAHHVDHVIPLQGELVSGLHVENNLQVLHWRANVLKRNRFEVEA